MLGLKNTALDSLKSYASHKLTDSFEEDEACKEASNNLYSFVKYVWHVIEPVQAYCDGWHIQVICEHLQAVARFEIKNLLINIPPRHAKSLITAVAWPAWLWINNPGRKFLFTSYAESLSYRDSRRCRALINSPFYQMRWGGRYSFSLDNNQVRKFENTRGGYRIATSTTGLGTGEGADHIVADDPNKVADAHSTANLTKVHDYWDSTLSSRYNNINEFTRVVIMQRLSERDLSGHILTQHRANYEHLCLPAEYEPKRFFELGVHQIIPTKLQQLNPNLQDNAQGSGRVELGDPLWPQRMDNAALNEFKRTLSAVGIAGQLQQRPTPEAGAVFEKVNFRYFTNREGKLFDASDGRELASIEKLWWVQVGDTAQKISDAACWTVVGTAGISSHGDIFVYHLYRERLEVPDQLGFLSQASVGQGLWDRKRRGWSIQPKMNPWPFTIQCQFLEEKSSGIGLIQEAARSGMCIRPLKPQGDKIQRCTQIVNSLCNHKVYFPAEASWLSAFEAELLSFPYGSFDDQVDVFAYIGQVSKQSQSNLYNSLRGDLKTVAERLGI